MCNETRRHRGIERLPAKSPASPSTSPPESMADASDDLDELLDSALADFTKLDLSAAQRSGIGRRDPLSLTPPASAGEVQGLGLGLPDLKTRRKREHRSIRAAANSTASHASEALEKLTQQTREAVKGLESTTGATFSAGSMGGAGFDNESMVEEFVKQFEELAGSQDMGSIVDTMMQQLLSKEILHEPMKEIGERYPKWLEEHKSGLSKEKYDRYHQQCGLILQLNDVYENDSGNFSKIVDLMQKMQECGQPPDDIIQELAPDLDISNLGQLSPGLLDSSPNCSIM